MQELIASISKWVPPLSGRGADRLAEGAYNRLLQEQFQRLRGRVPILYLALAIITIAAAFAAQGDFPEIYQYAIPGALLFLSMARLIVWMRRPDFLTDPVKVRKHLVQSVVTTSILMSLAGFWAMAAFLETHESRRALAPVFQILAAFASASCLAPVPRASIAAMVFGLLPVAVVMLLTGDVGIMAMAISMAVVAVLQGRLVLNQANELVRSFGLQFELERQANTDPLTGLLNRRAFANSLQAALAQGNDFAVLMLDLNGFKPVNDQFGHAAGDETLIAVAHRLRASCRAGDPVARLGGDEFAMILPVDGNPEILAGRVDDIKSLLAEPYYLDMAKVIISASVGTARPGARLKTASGLLEAADRALYASKSGNKVQPIKRQAA